MSNYKVMVVDDSPTDLKLMSEPFLSQGYDLVTATDGEEALNYIEHWPVDAPLPVVILLDLKLPKVDGLEVLRQMKAHPQLCTVPTVILTTSAENTDVKAAYQLGVNSYIIKPINFDKFMEVAEQIDLYWNVLNKPPT